MKKIKVLCNKCGQEAPIDKQKSNKNWSVYLTKDKCKCGGDYKFKIIV